MLIASTFGVQPEAIFLTSPTFFSEMTSNPAKTVHDEYWHPHVDKVYNEKKLIILTFLISVFI